MDSNSSDSLARLYPVGSKVRIIGYWVGIEPVELFDSYTVRGYRGANRLLLIDRLGNRFGWNTKECVHPGVGLEWLHQNSPAFAKGSATQRLLRDFVGKRFLRLRPAIRDRILLQQPDLKQRILDLLHTLQA
jgi:hypothetical protein